MGGSKQQTTTSNSEPWKGAQPALNTALSSAQNLYNSGVGAQSYTGSTVVPFNKHTTQGLAQINQAGVANSGGRGLSGQYQGIINAGGYNPAQLEALNNTRSVANSQFDINEDPGFAQVRDQAMNAVNSSASSAGRYGSGANQALLGNTIGDLGARQYQAWQGRKDAANSNLFNMGQQGFGNLESSYAGMNAPNQDILNVGAAYEDLSRRYKNDELRRFDESQQKPWENLSRLNAIASGSGQLGGTQTQSQPGANPFLSALGYGSAGAGILGSFF